MKADEEQLRGARGSLGLKKKPEEKEEGEGVGKAFSSMGQIPLWIIAPPRSVGA